MQTQTDRQTGRQAGRQADRQAGRQAGRQKYRQTCAHTEGGGRGKRSDSMVCADDSVTDRMHESNRKHT